jgi:hypothetical protein
VPVVVPCGGFWCPTNSARCGFERLPPRRSSGLGVFFVVPDSPSGALRDPPVEFNADFRVLSFASARARLADAPHHFRGEEPLVRPGPPLVRFLPLRTPLRRVPRVAGTAFAASEDGGRQTSAGAVLRVLAPLDGSGCRTRHARILANPPSPWRPDASRSCFIPLAPLESPFRAFPSRGAVPALAGLLLPCGFAFDPPNGAARTEVFAAPFPVRADLSPRLAREGWPDWKAVT